MDNVPKGTKLFKGICIYEAPLEIVSVGTLFCKIVIGNNYIPDIS